MKFSETKWMALVVKGPRRQHLMQGFEPQTRRREVWAEALKVYAEAYREDFNDPKARQAYDALSKDWTRGVVVPVKVSITWGNR